MKSKWLIGAVLALAIFPALAFAAHINPNTNVWSPAILAGPLTVCTGNYLGSQGPAPYQSARCQDLCDFVAEIIQILYFIIGVGIWIIIPILFGYSGVQIILARGNPAKVSEARKSLTGALIGVVIMLCAWLIVSTFVGFFKLGNYVGAFGSNGNCIVSPAANGTLNNGTLNSGTLNSGTPNQGTLNNGTPNQGTLNNGTPNQGTLNNGTPNQGVLNGGN
jgi:hypothetical protein